jgi:hypothetical protein
VNTHPAILAALSSGPLCCAELARKLKRTNNSVRHTLWHMVKAGQVVRHRSGGMLYWGLPGSKLEAKAAPKHVQAARDIFNPWHRVPVTSAMREAPIAKVVVVPAWMQKPAKPPTRKTG